MADTPAMTRHLPTALLLATASLALAGCNYYQVHDPSTGKTYYTHSWQHEHYKNTGAIQFTDEATGSNVTLQSHEVRKIKGRQFKTAVARQEDQLEPR